VHALILLAQHHWTGAAEPTLQIARGLREGGHRVTFVFTRRPAGHLAPHVEAARVGVLPAVLLQCKGFHPLSMWRDRRLLRRFIKDEQVDVLFCHHSHDHWLAWTLRWNMVRPPALVRQLHMSKHLARRSDLAFLYKHSDRLIVPGESWQNRLIENYSLPAERIVLLSAAVDTDVFQPTQPVEAIRREINAGPDTPLVCLVSRIKPGRGHDLALAAMEIVRQSKPDARLLFVGRGEGKDELRALVRNKRADAWAHFLGYRSDDLPAIYAACGASLLLGEGSDGACRAALEATACGTPVIALPVGALPDTLLDGQTGFFAAAQPDDVAAKIIRTLDETALAASARQYAEENFAIKRRVDRAETILTEAMQNR